MTFVLWVPIIILLKFDFPPFDIAKAVKRKKSMPTSKESAPTAARRAAKRQRVCRPQSPVRKDGVFAALRRKSGVLRRAMWVVPRKSQTTFVPVGAEV